MNPHNPILPDPEKGLFAGVRELVSDALFAKPSSHRFCSKGGAKELAAKNSENLNLTLLIETMWKQIVANWVEGGCQWRGSKNWHWTVNPTLNGEEVRKVDNEVRLNRLLIRQLGRQGWANEVPTGSGMGREGEKEPGGLDLAHCTNEGHLIMVELKTRGNPVEAAFQLVTYALLLNLARLVHHRLVPTGKPSKIDDRWLRGKKADLFVVAPAGFYEGFRTLRWFEQELGAALKKFHSPARNLAMSFKFREFNDGLLKAPQADEFLRCIDRPVDWS